MFNDLTIENEWMLKLLQALLDRLTENKAILISSISTVYVTALLMGVPQHQLQTALEFCYQNESFPRSDFSSLLKYIYFFLQCFTSLMFF